MNEAPQEMSQPPKTTWWRRNWKWVVPMGCVSVSIPLLFCGCFALIFTGVFGALKSSDVYQEAVAKAKENKAVQAAIGTPIQEGFFVNGNINLINQGGNANLAIPISGPKGSATVNAVAQKLEGRWIFSTLEVAIEGGNRINLLANN
jgi:hypothetical protein